MNRINLKNTKIHGTHFDKLQIFLDDDGNVILLPMLWAIHISNTGSVYSWHKRNTFNSSYSKFNNQKAHQVEKYFELRPVSENTINNYFGHLFNFFKYINKLNKDIGTPSAHFSELVNSKLINHYLNVVLPEKLQSSSSLNAHQAAISAYYSFLHELEIKDVMLSTIYRKTRQLIAELDSRPKKINYVSRSERSLLLQTCSSYRDRLILRMGFEVGLRTEENKGLILNDFKAKNIVQKGLLKLFSDLDRYPSKQSFEFVLSGKYSKGGKTRNIYFDRELLISMKKYYDNERLIVEQTSERTSDSLFLRTDPVGIGLPISTEQASNTFSKVLKQCPNIYSQLSYHDLRHTFATELYHAELLNQEGRETRSESAALIVVSERLGHKDLSTTRRYIRLRQQMLIIENDSL